MNKRIMDLLELYEGKEFINERSEELLI